MKFRINCDEATAICDKSQYGEASLLDRMKLSYHLLLCRFCKSYSKQNNLMTSVFDKFTTPCQGDHKLSEEQKERLSQELKEEIKTK